MPRPCAFWYATTAAGTQALLCVQLVSPRGWLDGLATAERPAASHGGVLVLQQCNGRACVRLLCRVAYCCGVHWCIPVLGRQRATGSRERARSAKDAVSRQLLIIRPTCVCSIIAKPPPRTSSNCRVSFSVTVCTTLLSAASSGPRRIPRTVPTFLAYLRAIMAALRSTLLSPPLRVACRRGVLAQRGARPPSASI